MGINAGLIIPTTQSSISYDSNAGVWKGVIIQINYLFGQNSGSNPPVVGDIIVDQEPRVWEITATGGSLSGNRFGIDTKCLSETPSLQVIPKLNTQRGMICSPNAQGFIDPHWDSTVVELVPFRMAMRYNFNMNPKLGNLGSGGSGGSSGGVGVPKARSISNTTPSYVQDGSIYIIGTNPTGVWAGQTDKIAVYNSGSWSYEYPEEGDLYWIEDLNNYYYYSHLGNWEVFEAGGGGSGVTNFLQLNDTPSSFSGKAGHVLRVNTSSSAVEFVDPSNFSTAGGDTGGGDTGGSGDGGSGSGTTYTASNITTQTTSQFPVKTKTGDYSNPTVATSETHFLMIGSDGKLYASGDNSVGQFGIGNTSSTSQSIPHYSTMSDTFIWKSFDHGSINYKKVYARYDSSACIDINDVLYVWGDNRDKKLGSNTVPFLTSPEKITTPVGVKKFEIGERYSYYMGTDNHLYRSNQNGGYDKYSTFQIKDFTYYCGHIFLAHSDGNVYWARDSIQTHLSEYALSKFNDDNFYVKTLTSVGISNSSYDSMGFSLPNTNNVQKVAGTTEYNTVYKGSTNGGYIETIWGTSSLAPSGIKQIIHTHTKQEPIDYVVTNDDYFIGKASTYISKSENISNVNYVIASPTSCYIIFNDGSIKTHQQFMQGYYNWGNFDSANMITVA